MKHVQYLKGLLSRRGLPILVVVVAIAGILGISQLSTKQRQAEVTPPPPPAVEVMEIIPLTKANAGPKADLLHDSFVLAGYVHPNRVVTVSSELTAVVEKLPQEKGSFVKKGDLLAVLNKGLVAPALECARATEVDRKRDLDRVKELLKRNAARQSEIDGAQTLYDLAKANLETALVNYKHAEITAPCSGILDERPVEVGQCASMGTVIAKIVDMDTVKVAVDVPERDIRYLKVGDKAGIRAGYAGDEASVRQLATGKITFISVQASPLSHTTPIEILVANAPGSSGDRPFYTNQRVDVVLTRRELPSLVAIPLEAVIPLERAKVVYVVEKGRAREREVQIGSIRGSAVQILAGLAQRDLLIVKGQREVSDGQKVSIVPRQPLTDGASVSGPVAKVLPDGSSDKSPQAPRPSGKVVAK